MRTNDGWISLHRKFLEWEWYTDLPTKSLAIHFLLKANHRPQKWRGIEIGRGQFITSRATLAKETGLSVKQIRTAEQRLENCEFSASQRTNRYSVVTICNYESYQGLGMIEGQTAGQSRGKQRAINNNDNNINKKYTDDFEAFFEQYHSITSIKKSDEEPASRHWNKLTASEKQKALENIQAYFNSLSDPKYCKKARTYLADKNFNDEFKTSQPTTKPVNLIL